MACGSRASSLTRLLYSSYEGDPPTALQSHESVEEAGQVTERLPRRAGDLYSMSLTELQQDERAAVGRVRRVIHRNMAQTTATRKSTNAFPDAPARQIKPRCVGSKCRTQRKKGKKKKSHVKQSETHSPFPFSFPPSPSVRCRVPGDPPQVVLPNEKTWKAERRKCCG